MASREERPTHPQAPASRPDERTARANGLGEAVRRQRERRARAHREGGRSLGRDLAEIGVIGWTVVVPMLLGILAGRWLDRRFGTGIFWTLGLLAGGTVLGCALGWRRLMRP